MRNVIRPSYVDIIGQKKTGKRYQFLELYIHSIVLYSSIKIAAVNQAHEHLVVKVLIHTTVLARVQKEMGQKYDHTNVF